MTKRCSKCGVDKPATSDNFYNTGRGLSHRCIACARNDKHTGTAPIALLNPRMFRERNVAGRTKAKAEARERAAQLRAESRIETIRRLAERKVASR